MVNGLPTDAGPWRADFPSERFPTVAETTDAAHRLVESHPELCRLRRVGTSRGGEPLLLLSVGNGRRNTLVVAGAHANEPVGWTTAIALAGRVAKDTALHAEVDGAWHFLLCLDPDGARLNAPFPPGPRSLFDVHRTFFRPAGAEQPEWAPTVRPPHDVLPETRALTDVIDELRPFLQCSLHGHDVGGSWIQLTRPVSGLAEPFAESAAAVDIPVEHGSFDTLLWPSPRPGIFVAPAPDVRERFPSLLEDVERSTWGGPHRYGGMTAAVEVPMWGSRLVEDRTPHPAPEPVLRELATRLRDGWAAASELLSGTRPHLTAADGPLLRAVAAALEACASLPDDWEKLALPDPYQAPLPTVTRGHLAALDIVTRRIPLRAAAMTLQLVDTAEGQAAAAPRKQLTRFMAEQCEALENTFQPRWIPVAHQVRHQARTVVEVFTKALERV